MADKQIFVEKWITEEVSKTLLKRVDGISLKNLKATECQTVKNTPSNMIFLPFKFDYQTSSEISAEKRFVAKMVPDNEDNNFKQIFRDSLIQDGLISSETLPNINDCLDGINEKCLRYPALYYTKVIDHGEELLVFEDIIYENLKMNEYSTTMSIDDSKHVMEAYAKLHAGSIILDDKKLFLNDNDIPDICLKDVEKSLKGMIESNISLLDRSDGFKELKEWITNSIIKEDVFQKMKSLFEPTDKFKVLTHGSIGENLIYFGQNQQNEREACLSSFGGAKMASPAVDLINFFFVCLDSETRQQKSQLLKFYYDRFESILLKGKLAPPFSLAELELEVENKILIGLFAAIQTLPRYLGGSELNLDLSSFNKNGMDSYLAVYKLNLESLYEKNNVFKTRLLDMFTDLKHLVR